MSRKIALIGSFATDWIRYSDYEYKESESGELYIAPTVKANFSMYNPFDVAEDLLIDLMRIGEWALKADGDADEKYNDELKKTILIFAKKYGLLGLISASVYNRNIVGDDTVMSIENNHVTKEKIMDGTKYMNLFIPFAEEGEVVVGEYKNSVYLGKSEDSPKFYGKRPVVMDLIFSRFYAEQVKWIIDFAKMIVSHFNQLLMYRNSSTYLVENVTIMAGQFHAEKIGFTINQLDKTTIAWQFDSLKTTIETIYAFAVTDEKILLNRCSHCGSVFIAKSDREKYCNPACRNRANVKKSRSKKAGQLEER
ncbi:CGNR zinc finger domain-containing protein [Wukongibacter baidiensis]|uniref:CGNR zinc finger domain-containing protein n=1 Tax=Wukongibacter baidiensis TaxID=1723361 RepID=UPI003D7F8893